MNIKRLTGIVVIHLASLTPGVRAIKVGFYSSAKTN